MIRVCLAGAIGWAGSELARAIVRTSDLQLARGAGRRLGEVLGDATVTAMLLQRFAESAARLIPQWEIVDYDAKQDAADRGPSRAGRRTGVLNCVRR